MTRCLVEVAQEELVSGNREYEDPIGSQQRPEVTQEPEVVRLVLQYIE
jgi:hypothetical protein